MVKEMGTCINGPNLLSVKNGTVKLLLENNHREKIEKGSKKYPIARWKHASVVIQNSLYIMGGCSWTSVLRDLWCLNLEVFSQTVENDMTIKGYWKEFESRRECDNLWQDLSTFIRDVPPLQSHTMVAYENQLYIFGGTFVYDARDCPLWVYSLEFQIIRKWKSVSNSELPNPRRNHSCSIYRDTMFIYGGFGDVRGSFGDLWAFDLRKEKWYLLWSFNKHSKDLGNGIVRPGPRPRHDHMSVVHNNGLWIYGGMSGLEECDDLWKWNIEERDWTRINFKTGPLDVRCISNIVVRQNWIFYCSNETKKKIETWKYNFRSKRWTCDYTTFTDLPCHSTICLSSSETNRGNSINQSDSSNMRRNKVHPEMEISHQSKLTNDYLCLSSCSKIGTSLMPIKMSQNSNFHSLTPVSLSPEQYAYSNHDCFDQLETVFAENLEESITTGVPKSKQYIILVGNNIDKASFDNDIGIHFSLIK